MWWSRSTSAHVFPVRGLKRGAGRQGGAGKTNPVFLDDFAKRNGLGLHKAWQGLYVLAAADELTLAFGKPPPPTLLPRRGRLGAAGSASEGPAIDASGKVICTGKHKGSVMVSKKGRSARDRESREPSRLATSSDLLVTKRPRRSC